MEENYDVYLGDKPIGKAWMTREGLYRRIRCRCQLTGEVICKLTVTCGKNQESLGVLVPMEGDFGLETRIAAKKLGEEEPHFRVMPRHEELRGKFVPLAPEEPFRYIARLKDAYLERRNGQVGVVIKESGCG